MKPIATGSPVPAPALRATPVPAASLPQPAWTRASSAAAQSPAHDARRRETCMLFIAFPFLAPPLGRGARFGDQVFAERYPAAERGDVAGHGGGPALAQEALDRLAVLQFHGADGQGRRDRRDQFAEARDGQVVDLDGNRG